MKVLTTFGFRTMRFVLDTGSDITTISRATADDMRIPFDTQLRRVAVNGMGGRTHGVLTELVVRLFGMERTIPCVIADPAPTAREPRSERQPLNLLGRAGFLTELCDISIRRRHLIVTRRLSVPDWLQGIVTRFYPTLGEIGSDEPI